MKNDFFRSQFRFPGPLYDRLRESAEQQGRSLNAEIVARLESSFGPDVQTVLSSMLEEQTRVLIDEIRRVHQE